MYYLNILMYTAVLAILTAYNIYLLSIDTIYRYYSIYIYIYIYI